MKEKIVKMKVKLWRKRKDNQKSKLNTYNGKYFPSKSKKKKQGENTHEKGKKVTKK